MRLLLGGAVAAALVATAATPAPAANPWVHCQPVAQVVCTVLDRVALVLCPRTTVC